MDYYLGICVGLINEIEPTKCKRFVLNHWPIAKNFDADADAAVDGYEVNKDKHRCYL